MAGVPKGRRVGRAAVNALKGPLEDHDQARRGMPGGYWVWGNRGRRWWGDLYELCPDDLVLELNGPADHARITALMKRYRAQKR
ncbi:hypothetical protein [Streptomyces sp. NBC_01615]|uniref:hypothetical protein n=1 Tax=Streptomyces sp. NBC_01615 TaxID=2975898 RepID=UPI00386428CB